MQPITAFENIRNLSCDMAKVWCLASGGFLAGILHIAALGLCGG